MICVKVKKKKRALVKILIEQNFIATWNKVIFKNLIRLDSIYLYLPCGGQIMHMQVHSVNILCVLHPGR